MKKQFPLIILLIVSSIAFCSLASAQDQNVLNVCASPLEPWKMFNDGKFEGAEIDLAIAVGEKLGLEVKFESIPFKRCLYKMETGETDMMTGMLKRKEREEYTHFIDPHYKNKSNKAFYVLKGSSGLITKYEDLYKLRIGVRRGSKYFPRFDSDNKIKKDAVNKEEQNFSKLIEKRIDALVITDSQGDYLVNALGYKDKIVKADWGFNKMNPVYMGVSKNTPLKNRAAELKELLAEMTKSGEAHQIIDHYFIRNNLPIPDYK